MNTETPRPFRFGLSGHLGRDLALLTGLSVLLCGCMSLQSVPVPTAGEPSTVTVKVGEKVTVQTRTGHILAFAVTAIEADALVGGDLRVPYRDTALLQVERLDKTRTTIAVVAVVVVAGGTIAAVNALHTVHPTPFF